MAQYIQHDQVHPRAGRWGQSIYVWHRLKWLVDGDRSGTDGGSLCDRYIGPPYLARPPQRDEPYGWAVCKKCISLERNEA